MIPNNVTSQRKELGEWAILVGYRGSISHGMYVPDTDPDSIDDKDVIAACVPPIDWYFGLPGNRLFPSNGTREIKSGEWDIVSYEAKKFIGLLAQGNPNVLSALWMKEKNYIKVTKQGRLIIDNRNLFVGRHVYRSFTGYAHSQFHRMTAYVFDGYMGKKRKALVDKFGYDTKNAAHLIRLLRMGIEFLRDGELYVEREDATQLLDVKRGRWTLDQVKAESARLFVLLDEAYVRSSLPKSPDLGKISELSVSVIRSALSYRQLY